MRLSFSFSLRPIWAALALVLSIGAGCTVVNPNHCGNQSGHATCRSRSESLPYCNLCTATHDGCTDEAPVESRCQPDDEPLEPSTGSTSTVASTSTEDGSDAPATSLETTSSTTADGATGDASTTDTGTTHGASDSGDQTGTTEATSGDTEGQRCGNGIREGTEECDGEDFGGATCQSAKGGDPHWQGQLHCTGLCTIYDDECCLGVGAPCLVVANDCCGTCQLNGLQCAPP